MNDTTANMFKMMLQDRDGYLDQTATYKKSYIHHRDCANELRLRIKDLKEGHAEEVQKLQEHNRELGINNNNLIKELNEIKKAETKCAVCEDKTGSYVSVGGYRVYLCFKHWELYDNVREADITCECMDDAVDIVNCAILEEPIIEDLPPCVCCGKSTDIQLVIGDHFIPVCLEHKDMVRDCTDSRHAPDSPTRDQAVLYIKACLDSQTHPCTTIGCCSLGAYHSCHGAVLCTKCLEK